MNSNTKSEPNSENVRLSRFLSKAGLCSRRKAKEFLEHNKVFADGIQLKEPGQSISVHSSLIINGKSYKWRQIREVYLFNKPEGYVCSHKSHKSQPSIFSLLPEELNKLYFAGRLDQASCGLMVLSNDGDLIFELTHPSKKTEKKYFIHASRPISEAEINKMLKGVFDKNEKLKFDRIVPLSKPAHYEITMHTGKNREIRRVLGKFNIRPLKLKRLQLGAYKLKSLPEGKYRKIE